eukprot:TRINITY_DN12580_c0_g1_i1.p1 TRINITY_DN12580_c0_g1~~TRINITY_DN12580_c0_g1_i1.p1  ORF type:complete len:74 (+),score=1.83 TRINITY_DN12580_c0_g1_i1:121-342(+)
MVFLNAIFTKHVQISILCNICGICNHQSNRLHQKYKISMCGNTNLLDSKSNRVRHVLLLIHAYVKQSYYSRGF